MTGFKRKIAKALAKLILVLVLVTIVFGILAFFFIGSLLGDLRIFIPELKKLTGFPDSQKTYLVIFQNNNEIRPAGGFITAYGLIKFDKGILQNIEINDVYVNTDTHKYIAPPYPLNEFLDKDNRKISFSFRDANFYPSFPDSARSLEKMFLLTNEDANIDGIFAVNYSFLEDLLASIGPVDVDGQSFDKNSLFSEIEHTVNDIDKHNIDDLKNRKNILKDFANELIKKLKDRPSLLKNLCDVTQKSLDKKDIQLYFKDEKLESLVLSQEWGGQWPTSTSIDFLAFNEANLGGFKSDRYMKRDVTYHLKVTKDSDPSKFKLTAKVDAKVSHYGLDNVPISGNYEGYFRVYVPKNSKLIENKSETEKFKESDKGFFHVFEGMLKLKPGEEKEISYTYQLPSILIKDNKYSLYIPKQSGTENDFYTVVIELPQGYSVKSDSFESRENLAIYKGTLNHDLSFDLEFSTDKSSPYVIYQNIDTLGQITVGFNENISQSSLSISNFQIIDTNKKNTNFLDYPKVTSISSDGKNLKLFIEGMTVQSEERYSLVLSNIKDLDGNKISPDPRTVTLVQRIK